MFTFKQYHTLYEGGAGGHMAHPFNLPEVRTGKDLVDVFNRTADFLSTNTAPVKIDGTNASVRLVVNDNGNKEFAFYRGAKKDVETAITIDKLEQRFETGIKDVAKIVLTIFNESINTTLKELKLLGLYDDPLIGLNTEYVQGSTNVIGYKNKFLAIHFPFKIVEKRSEKRGSISYESKQIPYNAKVLNAYVEKLNTIAQNYGYNVIHQEPARLVNTPDFNKVLLQTLTINGDIKTLREWLSMVRDNPYNKSITLKDGRRVSAMNQGLYVDIAERGAILGDLVVPDSIQNAVEGIIFWHATRALGKELLSNIESNLGKGDTQEGIVIANDKISPVMFKVTGDFFLRNQLSPFKKTGKPTSKVVVIYPGRFQPFHLGHAAVYKALVKQFPGSDVIIATSDKVELPNSPFTFDERKQMIAASGIASDAIQKVKVPYVPKEVLAQYDPANTIAIFAVGKKDMKGKTARFTFAPKKDGSPSYYQPFTSVNESETLDKHGYIVVAPTTVFKVLGTPVDSASSIREMWVTADEKDKKQIIKDLYGKFIPEFYSLFDSKLGKK